jgi:hypothetical protein
VKDSGSTSAAAVGNATPAVVPVPASARLVWQLQVKNLKSCISPIQRLDSLTTGT